MTRLRLTKKEKDGVCVVAHEGIGMTTRHLVEVLNTYGDGEIYTPYEVVRITSWIWKKLGLGA